MSDAANFSGLDGQHVELLPARVVMSVYACGVGVIGSGSGSEAGAHGGAGGAGGNGGSSTTALSFLFGGDSGGAGAGGAGGAAQGGLGAPVSKA